MRPTKPPLEPKWAIIFSLGVFPGGLIGVTAAHLWYLLPLATAFVWYLVFASIVVSISQSSIEWHTRNAAVSGHNRFVFVALCVVIVAAITSGDHQPFPIWGIVLLVAAGIAGYSVAGYHRVWNFLRWQRGEFDNDDACGSFTGRRSVADQRA